MNVGPKLKLLPDGPFIEIDGDSLYLGRDCHLAAWIPALKNRLVSSRHCCLKKELGGRWTLEDLHSTNGTWLSGNRLGRREVLSSGNVLSLGRNGPSLLVELPPPADATLVEDDVAAAETVMASPDGSAERPYRVGKTPEVEFRDARSGELLIAKGYTVVLGRDPTAAQIVLTGENRKHVSARHAEMQFRSDGRVVVRDLGSRNASWLNGVRLDAEQEIAVGDTLVLGAPQTTLTVTRLEQ